MPRKPAAASAAGEPEQPGPGPAARPTTRRSAGPAGRAPGSTPRCRRPGGGCRTSKRSASGSGRPASAASCSGVRPVVVPPSGLAQGVVTEGVDPAAQVDRALERVRTSSANASSRVSVKSRNGPPSPPSSAMTAGSCDGSANGLVAETRQPPGGGAVGADHPPAGLADVVQQERLVEVGHLRGRLGVEDDGDRHPAAAVVVDRDVDGRVDLAGRRQEGDGQGQEDEGARRPSEHARDANCRPELVGRTGLGQLDRRGLEALDRAEHDDRARPRSTRDRARRRR